MPAVLQYMRDSDGSFIFNSLTDRLISKQPDLVVNVPVARSNIQVIEVPVPSMYVGKAILGFKNIVYPSGPRGYSIEQIAADCITNGKVRIYLVVSYWDTMPAGGVNVTITFSHRRI